MSLCAAVSPSFAPSPDASTHQDYHYFRFVVLCVSFLLVIDCFTVFLIVCLNNNKQLIRTICESTFTSRDEAWASCRADAGPLNEFLINSSERERESRWDGTNDSVVAWEHFCSRMNNYVHTQ